MVGITGSVAVTVEISQRPPVLVIGARSWKTLASGFYQLRDIGILSAMKIQGFQLSRLSSIFTSSVLPEVGVGRKEREKHV